MEAKVLNTKGEEVGKVPLRDDVFGVKASKEFLHEVITIYRANQRAWSANTKTRSEVSGGGKKPWKQKHTGRARAGSNRSPLWRHGGVIFGPHAGRVRLDMPRQKAKLALAQALSARALDGSLVCVKALALTQSKTKEVSQILAALGCTGATLVVLDAPNPQLTRASRNIPRVLLRLAADINAYEVLRCRRLIITEPALEKISARWN